MRRCKSGKWSVRPRTVTVNHQRVMWWRRFKEWRQARIIRRAPYTAPQWQQAFARLPLLRGMRTDEHQRLQRLATLFLHAKTFEGAQGMVITPAMQLHIALQACLPILELGLNWYRGWTTIIMYPDAFVPERVSVDETGVAHHRRDVLSGESWQRGPVILSWRDAAEEAGHNVVIHEFAHKLDGSNGEVNGFPPLHPHMDAAAWTRDFSAAFADFQHNCDTGIEIGIDCYAGTDPAEFFAVISEVFFERPALLVQHYPQVYAQLRQFYRQDPLRRS
jgi:MtfA peptidase